MIRTGIDCYWSFWVTRAAWVPRTSDVLSTCVDVMEVGPMSKKARQQSSNTHRTKKAFQQRVSPRQTKSTRIQTDFHAVQPVSHISTASWIPLNSSDRSPTFTPIERHLNCFVFPEILKPHQILFAHDCNFFLDGAIQALNLLPFIREILLRACRGLARRIDLSRYLRPVHLDVPSLHAASSFSNTTVLCSLTSVSA